MRWKSKRDLEPSITPSNRICAHQGEKGENLHCSVWDKKQISSFGQNDRRLFQCGNVDASKKRRLQHATIRPSGFASNATPALANFSRFFRPAGRADYGEQPARCHAKSLPARYRPSGTCELSATYAFTTSYNRVTRSITSRILSQAFDTCSNSVADVLFASRRSIACFKNTHCVSASASSLLI